VSDVGVFARLSGALLNTWRKGLDRFAVHLPELRAEEADPELLFIRARTLARAGDFDTAARLFARVAELAPSLGEALEAHGEILDMSGQTAEAMARYEAVRRLRTAIRETAPDRTFVLRQRRRYTAEIAAYTSVLHSIRRHALPYVARGNAYLAEGRPVEALADYESALRWKPNLPEVKALKAEALAMMGQYEGALEWFDAAVAARPRDAEILGGRAITRLVLGKQEDADADWHRQFDLLPAQRASARACVALRLAAYAKALPELERALEKEPADPYWQLYRLTAMKRLGRPQEAIGKAAAETWPAPLLDLYAGRISPEEVLKQADTAERRAEALFQIAILAWPDDKAEARRRLSEIIERAAPSMIEYAAARHELAQLGA
jgi:tetratricopeptide (TPR) repeat protein